MSRLLLSRVRSHPRAFSAVAALCLVLHAGAQDRKTNSYASAVLTWASWGGETNGLRFGLGMPATNHPFAKNRFMVAAYIFNFNPTNFQPCWRPPEGTRLRAVLVDESGHVVPCAASELSSALPDVRPRRADYVGLFAKSVFDYDTFDLLKSFKIQSGGTYTLTVEGEIFTMAASMAPIRLLLPKAELTLHISSDALQP